MPSRQGQGDNTLLYVVPWKEGPPSLPLHPQQTFSSEGFERIPRKNSASRYSSLPCQTTRVQHHPQPKSKYRERPATPQGPQPHSHTADRLPSSCPLSALRFLSLPLWGSPDICQTQLSSPFPAPQVQSHIQSQNAKLRSPPSWRRLLTPGCGFLMENMENNQPAIMGGVGARRENAVFFESLLGEGRGQNLSC